MTDKGVPSRILYVDDDPVLARLVQKRMRRAGFEIDHADTAEAAETMLAGHSYQAAILDHYLTTGTGLEILRRLRAEGTDLPVIYVTGSSEATVAVDALKAGADDYVIKSVGDEFFTLLERAILQSQEKARLRAEHARADAEMRLARERAEMLLSEVHHRVANSLAMVTSLLRMQASASENDDIRNALTEAQTRIAAVAGVHRGLYLGEDVQSIALDAYLETLMREFRRTLPPKISIEIEAAPIRISADRAVSLGIVVSELATNAVKYAWPDGNGGTLRIALGLVGENRARLAVEDDGIGSQQGQETQGTGLGQTLVRAMAERLSGTSTQPETATGTRIELTFPVEA